MELSTYFSNIVVRQGENLSPLLLSIFLNDLEDHMKASCRCQLKERDTVLFINLFMLYADDTIIIGESTEDLQTALTHYTSTVQNGILQSTPAKPR